MANWAYKHIHIGTKSIDTSEPFLHSLFLLTHWSADLEIIYFNVWSGVSLERFIGLSSQKKCFEGVEKQVTSFEFLLMLKPRGYNLLVFDDTY